jgi:hypothetical protein
MESGTEQYGAYASQPRNGNNANGPVPVAADQPRTGVCHATGRLSLAGPPPTDTLNDLSGTTGDGFLPESEPIWPANTSGSQTQNDESRSGIPRAACQSSESHACRATGDNGVDVIPRAASGHGLPRMARYQRYADDERSAISYVYGRPDTAGSIWNAPGTHGSSRAGPAADFMS